MRLLTCIFVACTSAPKERMVAPPPSRTEAPFAIDFDLVSNADYGRCVDDGACDGKRGQNNSDDPVQVDYWSQAAVYCQWRNARLPTRLEFRSAHKTLSQGLPEWAADMDPVHPEQRSMREGTDDYVFDPQYSPAGVSTRLRSFRCARSLRDRTTSTGVAFIPAGIRSFESCASEYGGPCKPMLVAVMPFMLDRLEATNADYAECIDEGACEASPYVFPREEPDVPAIVRWSGATAFCKWRGGRLPSATEWKSAAGGDGRRYPWGNESLDRCADVTLPACGNRIAVGSGARDVTTDGVHDMFGSVDEWVNDPGGIDGHLVRGESVAAFLLGGEGWHGIRCARDL